MSLHTDPATLASYIITIVVSLAIHEFMHAFVGYKLGDSTAQEVGRLSLNPLRHIDPFMTVLLPVVTLITIGAPILAAKPVPFDPRNIKYDEFGAALLAAAGPLSNLVLAIVGAVIANAIEATGFLYTFFTIFVQLNVALFIFNLVPIPPLDGSRVLYAFAPEPLQRFMQQIEPYGFFIVIFLVFATGFGNIIINLNQSVLNLLP
ncbi:MAG: Zn-dependent rane-bound protease, family protein [Candidatus Saccharibacteria bacterium]|nr:Zn-dependent rane-bound protease, family protein [Candidatus Saccharibacteria bacterium]